MRFLVKVRIPVEAGNEMVRDGKIGDRIKSILADTKPEAVYFAVNEGQRTIFMVVDVKDASLLPAIAEPLWLGLQADVETTAVLTEKEFAKAAQHIERAAKKY